MIPPLKVKGLSQKNFIDRDIQYMPIAYSFEQYIVYFIDFKALLRQPQD